MKRYLKVTGYMVFQSDEISKRDLIDVKSGSIDWVIDTSNGKYFDAKENKWLEIKSI